MVQEFAPLATNIQRAPIDFQIEGSGKNYIHLNNSTLEVRVKLITATGGEIATATKVSTVNLQLHSLFHSVTMSIADKVVTESNNIYPIRSLFETLVNYESEVMNTRLKCEGFEEDTALEDTNPASPGTNTGLKARDVKFKDRRLCD